MISDVRTESAFWLMKSGFLEVYPSLSEDVKADFVIVGGGISGALQTWHLAQKGAKVVLVDGRHFGMNSTAASTTRPITRNISPMVVRLSRVRGSKSDARAAYVTFACVPVVSDWPQKMQ